ncbi:hypothetical protein P154DRAFT_75664 [Amniculicola lignicola CBS 123094]|uniref:Uncharacterized protein n=1 Tax=Amniculicola lignicola CBS 123094 TaxID=1392246 RepID=A0A6A5VWZ2_9PLEO|nr:hypothetical protein P154DRAFT_75664 [Amniculicola lignicola CBS 123094]
MIRFTIPQTASLPDHRPASPQLSPRSHTMSAQPHTQSPRHKRFDSLLPSLEIPSSTLSAEAQWSLIEHRLHDLHHSQSQYSRNPWLSTVETPILLLAVAKHKAEVDLLRYEADHALPLSDSEPDNPFPNYNVGLHNTSYSSSSSASSQPASPRNRSSNDSNTAHIPPQHSPPTSPPPLPDIDPLSPLSPTFGHRRGSLLAGTVTRRRSTVSGPEKSDEETPDIEPLSPTFGVRRGSLMTGTVNRRRSIPAAFAWPLAYSPSPSPSAAMAPLLKSGEQESVQRDGEKRLLFEAAWVQIESHLGEYVRKFGFDGEGGGREEWRKEDVWMELVGLRGEVRGLEERIRGGEDIRG